MFDNLIGLSSDRATELMMWRWAEAHPYLFTAIKIMQPYVCVIIAVVGIQLAGKLFRGKQRAKYDL